MTTGEKRRIAAIGAQARIQSLQAARRILANFRYAAAVRTLGGGHPRIERLRTFDERLPGLYRDRV